MMERRRNSKSQDYGLSWARYVLASRNYGWQIKPSKKVVLVNVEDCKDRHLNVPQLAEQWRCGHSEWEYLLASMFVSRLAHAIENGDSEADITLMFNRDLTAAPDKLLTQEEIQRQLLKSFDVIEDGKDTLRLSLKI